MSKIDLISYPNQIIPQSQHSNTVQSGPDGYPALPKMLAPRAQRLGLYANLTHLKGILVFSLKY